MIFKPIVVMPHALRVEEVAETRYAAQTWKNKFLDDWRPTQREVRREIQLMTK